MADTLDPSVRSRIMARIRGKHTRPELLVRRFLWANGFRYRIHVRHLPGTPDIVLPAYRVAIFVHGCFWHGHPGCKDNRIPKSNVAFWENKLRTNAARDARQIADLQALGWQVLTVWECELHTRHRAARLVSLLKDILDQLPDFQADWAAQ
jgi:DNA mismatch endonuclease, patch repair protein